MSLWFLLVCHALTQNDAESPVDIFLSTSQKRSQKHMSTQKVFTSRHGLFVQISLSVWKLLKHFKHQNVIHDVSLRSISNSTFWMTFRTLLSLSSLRDKTNETSPINAKQSSFFRSQKWILRSSHDSFVQFCDRSSSTKTTQSIWKMVWFSMSLYKFKSSRCSPCNQSSQRRRKVYRCWVSSSPIKRAKHETCKYVVNHHGWSHHQGEKQIHFFQCRKDQWIHLTTDVTQFHTPFWDELHSIGINYKPSRLQRVSLKLGRSIHIVRIVPLSTIQWTTSS